MPVASSRKKHEVVRFLDPVPAVRPSGPPPGGPSLGRPAGLRNRLVPGRHRPRRLRRHRVGRASLRASAGLLTRGNVALFRKDYEIAKRALDLTVCLLVLPLVLVVMAVCAALIWIDDPGPVFFVQSRTGRGGRRFRMYKFRTMRTNAEELKAKYAHLNELPWPDFKITNDPRITPVGRWLRKTSLDEIPQIFNVLKGDMSLVGPRPTSFDVSTYSLWHTERLEVLPGITGLWQIKGRAELDFDRRLELDLEYIEHRSLWLDLCILCRTALVVFHQRGAY